MFTMFCGLGIFETSGNLLAGEVFTKNTAVMLNFMHLFYGLGSVIGPKFAGFYLISGHTWKQYYLYASFICIIFTMVFFSSLGYLITCFLGGILSEKLGHKITISIGYYF